MSKKLLFTFLIFIFLTINILGFISHKHTMAKPLDPSVPIYQDGSIIWKSPVGEIRLILGDPGSGGWFDFPYLYTCFHDSVLVWDFIKGYPELIYTFPEKGAKDIIIYDKYLLIQVEDGINIYEMETPTSFITYGGTFVPCENGKLLWGTSSISATQPTVHIMCPNGQIYGLHRWDFITVNNFQLVDHEIPIPPMVWNKAIGAYNDNILVSSSIPLFKKVNGKVICETENYLAVKRPNNTITVKSKTPPYDNVFTKQGNPICGSIDTIGIWSKVENSHSLQLWSNGFISHITLHSKPVSIYGSYDHFVISTTASLLLVSTNPPKVMKSISTNQPYNIAICNNHLCLTSEEESKILWIGIHNLHIFPSMPQRALIMKTKQLIIEKDFTLTPTESISKIFLNQQNKTGIVTNHFIYHLPGDLLPSKEISIDWSTYTLWWIKGNKVYSCDLAPVTLHMKDYISTKDMSYPQIWCLSQPITHPAQHGYNLFTITAVIIALTFVVKITKNKIVKKRKNSNRKNRVIFDKRKRGTRKRKVWRYSG